MLAGFRAGAGILLALFSLALCCFPGGLWGRAVTPSLVVPQGWLPCPGAVFQRRGVWQHEEADPENRGRDGGAPALPHRLLHQGGGAAPGAGTHKGRAAPFGELAKGTLLIRVHFGGTYLFLLTEHNTRRGICSPASRKSLLGSYQESQQCVALLHFQPQ